MSASVTRTAQSVTARAGLRQRVREIWAARELLVNLVRKELKVKYKNSALGFLWSMLNPALYLVIFYVVFQIVMKSGIPFFAIYLLSGLLVWNLFSAGLGGGTTSIVGNAGLVKKVYFPREILPLSYIGAALVHFALQIGVLALALVVFRYAPSPLYLTLVPVALVVLVLFVAALSILLSAVNVYLRDTAHLLELVLLAWFWMTPIVYQYRLVSDRLGRWGSLMLANPMTDVVLAFQRAIYNRVEAVAPDGSTLPILPEAGYWWYMRNLLIVGAVSFLLLLVASAVFRRAEGNFAEEI